MSDRQHRPITTSVNFGVRASSLRIRAITELIAVEPTSAFEKGDEYLGKQRTSREIEHIVRTRPFGVWHFCTEGLVPSQLVEDHVHLLLEKLEPARSEIQALCRDSNHSVQIAIWHVGPSGFYLPAELFQRLAALCDGIAITCWEVDEE